MCDLLSYLLTDKVIHRGAPLLKTKPPFSSRCFQEEKKRLAAREALKQDIYLALTFILLVVITAAIIAVKVTIVKKKKTLRPNIKEYANITL